MTVASKRPHACDLLASYLLAKFAVIEAGFESEIAWQESRCLEQVDERLFLREAAWVVLSSGMRETVIRKVFPDVAAAFGEWHSSVWIVEHSEKCRTRAFRIFRHHGKIDALIKLSAVVANRGVAPMLEELRCRGPVTLETLPYLGPATARHLAKNLGLDVAKPDRHLVRVATATGYPSPRALCEHLARIAGDKIAVVDLVIWRFATFTTNYLEFFRQQRCTGTGAYHDWLMTNVDGTRCRTINTGTEAWREEPSS